MTTPPPAAPLKPNPEMMTAHLRLAFGDCMYDALLELASTYPKDSNVTRGHLFSVEEFDGFAARAMEINQIDGQNVYVGAASRKTAADRNKRASGADCWSLPALYVDFDDPGMAEAAREKTRNFPPSYIVTTGRVPHLRQQYWWKLEEPLHDFVKSDRLLKRMPAAISRGRAARQVRLPS